MSKSLAEWLEAGEHLPSPLRDFHDQKDVFKAIDEIVNIEAEHHVDWIKAQIYVIDVFLWFMARRGYTLQRSRARHSFRSLEGDVTSCKARRDAASTAALQAHLSQSKATPEGAS